MCVSKDPCAQSSNSKIVDGAALCFIVIEHTELTNHMWNTEKKVVYRIKLMKRYKNVLYVWDAI